MTWLAGLGLLLTMAAAGQTSQADIGQSYRKMWRWNEAASFYAARLKSDPENPAWRYELAFSLEQAGKKNEAVPHYLWLIGQAGRTDDYINAYRRLHILDPRALSVIETDWLKAVETGAADLKTSLLAAETLLGRDDATALKSLCLVGITRFAGEGRFWDQLAALYTQERDFTRLLELRERRLRQGKPARAEYVLLADAHLRQRRFDQALQVLRQATRELRAPLDQAYLKDKLRLVDLLRRDLAPEKSPQRCAPKAHQDSLCRALEGLEALETARFQGAASLEGLPADIRERLRQAGYLE